MHHPPSMYYSGSIIGSRRSFPGSNFILILPANLNFILILIWNYFILNPDKSILSKCEDKANIHLKTASFTTFHPKIFWPFGILSFNPSEFYFILDPIENIEFYPIIPAKIEFNPFIRKERLYPTTRGSHQGLPISIETLPVSQILDMVSMLF